MQGFDPALLLGPLGLTAALILAVVVLARDHGRSDADVRRERDRALDLVERLTSAVEQDTRDRAYRKRQSDE